MKEKLDNLYNIKQEEELANEDLLANKHTRRHLVVWKYVNDCACLFLKQILHRTNKWHRISLVYLKSSRMAPDNTTDRSDEGRSVCLEGWTKRFGRWTFKKDSLWELAGGLSELGNLRSLHISVADDASSDNLDRFFGCTVSTGHFHVHLWYSATNCSVSVLLVHVDDDGTGQISEINSVVPDYTGLLLKNL